MYYRSVSRYCSRQARLRSPIVDFLKSNPDPKATKESAEQLAGALSDTRGNLESRKDLGVLRDVFGELAQWVSQLASLPPSSDATSRPADEELERAFAACCKAAREFRLQKKLVRESGSPNRDGLQKARQEYTKAMDELKQLFENRAGNRA